jgi:hypothetical protein
MKTKAPELSYTIFMNKNIFDKDDCGETKAVPSFFSD